VKIFPTDECFLPRIENSTAAYANQVLSGHVCTCVTVCGWSAAIDSVTTSATTTPSVQSGTALYCYECSEKYSISFDPANAPCLNNLTQITVRQCSPADRYCQVCLCSLYTADVNL